MGVRYRSHMRAFTQAIVTGTIGVILLANIGSSDPGTEEWVIRDAVTEGAESHRRIANMMNEQGSAETAASEATERQVKKLTDDIDSKNKEIKKDLALDLRRTAALTAAEKKKELAAKKELKEMASKHNKRKSERA